MAKNISHQQPNFRCCEMVLRKRQAHGHLRIHVNIFTAPGFLHGTCEPSISSGFWRLPMNRLCEIARKKAGAVQPRAASAERGP
jgi:hypothetical protein